MIPALEVAGLAEALDAQRYGGKASGLARLMAHGFRVPDGMVVAGDLEADQPERASGDATAPILEAFRRLAVSQPTGAWAVRSSAVGEDDTSHSWAGQLETELGVRGEVQLLQALGRVRDSARSERARNYQRTGAPALTRMGVIVQRQVAPRHAGVMFTQAPVGCGLDGRVVIEYVEGLADRLVDGEVDPGRVAIRRHDDAIEHLAPPPQGQATLSDHALSDLFRHARLLESAFGTALDVEWAIDDAGVLWVLQARPITTAVAIEPPPSEAAGPGPDQTGHVHLWTNANIAENFPDAVSPFLFSVVRAGYAGYFRSLAEGFGFSRRRIRSIEPMLERLVGIHRGRLYYDLTNVHGVLRQAPGGPWLARAFDGFVGSQGSAVSYARPAERLPRWLAWLEWPRVIGSVLFQFFTIERRLRAYERAVDEACAFARPDVLAKARRSECLQALLGLLRVRFSLWRGAALSDAAAMVCYALLARLVRAVSAPEETLHHRLLVGLPDLASHEPIERLWDLSRAIRADAAVHALFRQADMAAIEHALQSEARFAPFFRALAHYLDRWGFRGSGELMLTLPTPAEDLGPTLRTLKAYVESDGPSPHERLRAQAVLREQATEDALGRVSAGSRWLRFIPGSAAFRLHWLLTRTHNALRRRERARMQQARLYVHLRLAVRACGDWLVGERRIDRADDAFMFTHAELADLLQGGAWGAEACRALAACRQAILEEVKTRAAEDRFLLAEGVVVPTGGHKTNGVSDGASTSSGEALTGIAASGGRHIANACVMVDASEVDRLAPGSVVVTRQTDPGWACVFFLARGLVVERGGMLSHGAIIARELGIPAVVGVTDAMRRVPDGHRVEVDGDAGRVRILD